MKSISAAVRKSHLTIVLFSATLLLFCGSLSVHAIPVNLGSAADYAVVGVGGSVNVRSDFEIYQSDTVIYGNVAEGPYTNLTHGIDATIVGRWDYDTTDSNPAGSGYTGSVSGGFHQINLAGVAADARAASAAAAAYAPTQSFSTLGEGQTVTGGHGLNVIRITDDVVLKTFLTISGFPDSCFIFQLTSSTSDGHDVLNLSGMSMFLSGGVLSDNILWNMNGLGGGLNIKGMAASQSVYGTFLAPDRDILSDHGVINGRLIGGGSGNEVSIHSGSTVNAPPPPQTVPDGGSTFLMFGFALLGLESLRRKFAK